MSKLTVKDVRNLKVCVFCEEVGIYQPQHSELNIPLLVCMHSTETTPLTVPKSRRSFAHPRCHIEYFKGPGKLLTLHRDELEHIRISDVPRSVMMKLLKELERRRS